MHSRQDHLGSLRGFFNWLVAEGYLRSNPASCVTVGMPRRPRFLGTATPLIESFLSSKAATGHYNERSVVVVRSSLGVFDRFLGDRALSALDRSLVDDFQLALSPYMPNSRKSYFLHLRTFCGWLVEHGYLESNPTDGISLGTVPRGMPRSQSPEAIRAVLGACEDDTDRAIIWLMVGLGLRSIEVARAQWVDYNEAGQTLIVRGKGGHERLLPVIKPVATALHAVRDGRRSGPIISHRQVGRPHSPDSIRKLISDILWRSGVNRRRVTASPAMPCATPQPTMSCDAPVTSSLSNACSATSASRQHFDTSGMPASTNFGTPWKAATTASRLRDTVRLRC